MKKVLFIAPTETKNRFKGGISSFAETILDNKNLFLSQDIELTLFNNCIVNRKPGSNGKFSLSNVLNFIKTRKLLKSELRNSNYDSIYLNTSFGVSLLKDLLTLKKKYKAKYQVYLHIHFAGINNILTNNKLVRYLIKKNLKSKVSTIVSLSSVLKEEFVREGFDPKSIKVIYNFFDPSLPKIKLNELVEKNSSLDNRPTNFLFVGSFDKRKGFYDLINVFSSLDKNKARLILCGKPNDSEAQKVIEEKIYGKEIFEMKGYVSGENKNLVFKSSDVLVLPSYGEGLPITILEALNFGLPIISTPVGAIPEIITSDIGELIPPGDTDALKRCVTHFCNKEYLSKLSEQSLVVSEKYTFDEFARNFTKILKNY